jgi:hypothetical protein
MDITLSDINSRLTSIYSCPRCYYVHCHTWLRLSDAEVIIMNYDSARSLQSGYIM